MLKHCTAPAIALHSAQHLRIAPPFAIECDSVDAKIELAASVISDQLRWAEASNDDRTLHVLCTTSLSIYIGAELALSGRLCDAVAAKCGVRPVGIAPAYQCAGWGFALRGLAPHAGRRQLAVTILDVDIHDLHGCRALPLIGKVGYGVTTLLFEIPSGAALPTCDGPYPNSAFNEFIHAVRKQHRTRGRTRTFIPFLTSSLEAVARRLIGADTLAPNLHTSYGHCWGSDPWIGLIEALDEGSCAPGEELTVGSVAYGGYFALSNVHVQPNARWRRDGPPALAIDPQTERDVWTHAGLSLPFQ